MKKYMITAFMLLVGMGFSACSSEIENGKSDIDSWPLPYEEEKSQYTFNHPCAMYAQADFDRVKASLDNGTAPQAVKDEFEALKNSNYTRLPYTPSPTKQIVRGDATGTLEGKENYANAMRDAAAAYQMAILWKLTGNNEYAANAVNILNSWAATCTAVTSNDSNHMLAAGVQGYTFANAAEILRAYSGWAENDFNTFKSWMLNVFAPKNLDFMTRHQSTCDDHYWSNWDLVNMCSYLSIGILTENSEMVNYVVNYFYNGSGNGYIGKLVQAIFDDPLGSGEQIGQNQESGRDQGHSQMSTAVTYNLAQMAYTLYKQNTSVSKLNFFAANDNAIIKMGEYVALFNLRDGSDQANSAGSWLISAKNMPFKTYYYCVDCTCKDKNHSATHTQVADDTGRGSLRPGWEIVVAYCKDNGFGGFKYAKMAADKMRPEGGVDGSSRYGTNSGAFDQLGWGTLMLYK